MGKDEDRVYVDDEREVNGYDYREEMMHTHFSTHFYKCEGSVFTSSTKKITLSSTQFTKTKKEVRYLFVICKRRKLNLLYKKKPLKNLFMKQSTTFI